jgi:hypothetical protein
MAILLAEAAKNSLLSVSPNKEELMKNRNLTFGIIGSVLTCFALAPQARATCQEGCLTNSNTVLGDDALFNNSGNDNTRDRFQRAL